MRLKWKPGDIVRIDGSNIERGGQQGVAIKNSAKHTLVRFEDGSEEVRNEYVSKLTGELSSANVEQEPVTENEHDEHIRPSFENEEEDEQEATEDVALESKKKHDYVLIAKAVWALSIAVLLAYFVATYKTTENRMSEIDKQINVNNIAISNAMEVKRTAKQVMDESALLIAQKKAENVSLMQAKNALTDN